MGVAGQFSLGGGVDLQIVLVEPLDLPGRERLEALLTGS